MRTFIVISSCLLLLSCGQSIPLQTVMSLPYYNTADFTAQWIDKGSDQLKNMHTIPAFSFIDQNGNTVTERTVANKIYIADFFFTSCPGLCPRLTKNLKLVQDAFKEDDKVMILSHSVTPDKDSASILHRYAANYGVIYSKWRLLTGNKDSIYTIARKAYFADEDLGLQRNTNDFLHTENMLLIDQNRHIRGIYKGTSPIEMNNLIADVKLLEQEND
jgi:protein SCO1